MAPSKLFVVIAELEAPAEHVAEFLEICRFDSDHSRADEPGCRQFDVITSAETPNAIVLYEVYDDAAAFEIHRTTPHFAVFADALKRLSINRTALRFFTREHP